MAVRRLKTDKIFLPRMVYERLQNSHWNTYRSNQSPVVTLEQLVGGFSFI